MNATVEKPPARIDVVRHRMQIMEPEFKKALPPHITVERFARVAMTAINNNPDLVNKCDEKSLWNAMMRAAQDGLLPDGREGAIVPYKGQARWMPMIAGIRKLAHNSGDISTWEAHCVYEKDEFAFELGDEPFIRHRPALADRGKIIAAYSVATLKDGSKSREVMGIQEILGIRSKSKADGGPWNDKVFYPEMVRKTVARRHSKVLPLATDLDDLIRREDDMYDLEPQPVAQLPAKQERPRSLNSKLDQLVAPSNDEVPQVKVSEHTPASTTAGVLSPLPHE